MGVNISALATGISAVIVAMLFLGIASTTISPSNSDTLINSGIGLAFIMVFGTVLAKLK